MNKIKFYKNNGILDHEEVLNENSLANTNGMLIKCYMNDGYIKVGYSDPYKTNNMNEFDDEIQDYTYIWTWDNIDEEKHKLIGNDTEKYNKTYKKIIIKDINDIDAILYSNPRWGGRLTNKFEFIK